jgi:hypothetical protein
MGDLDQITQALERLFNDVQHGGIITSIWFARRGKKE